MILLIEKTLQIITYYKILSFSNMKTIYIYINIYKIVLKYTATIYIKIKVTLKSKTTTKTNLKFIKII